MTAEDYEEFLKQRRILMANKIKKYFDENTWNRINSQLVLFGRYNCTSRNPNCNNCNLKSICTYYKNKKDD